MAKKQLRAVSTTDNHIVLGYFNATWDTVSGRFGRTTAMLMENCISLCVQTLTSLSPAATSVYTPSGFIPGTSEIKGWHLLVYVLTRRSNLPDVCITRAMKGADCSTDHDLIQCILKMDVQVTRRRQAANQKQRLNVARLHTTTGRTDLRNSMLRAFASSSTTAENSINDDWESFCSTVYTAATEPLGYPRCVNADWFDYNDPATATLLRDNRAALQERFSHPQSQAAIQHHAQTKWKLQRELLYMEDSW